VVAMYKCEEIIEEMIESREVLLEAINNISDMKLIFIGLFVGISLVIIISIVWSYRYE